LITLLVSPDLCSKRWIWQQYDYSVRTNTIAGPGSDCAIVRVKETGKSIAISLDGNGRYCYLSPREGAMLNVAESCRNLATAGAVPIAATNNLNFGNPERPEIMAQLVEAIEGMAEACTFFETPITGGNVSLYNETLGEAIYPTPVMGIVGLLETALPVPMQFQNVGRAVLLIGGLGETDPVRFGSTQYAKTIVKHLWGLPPKLDLAREKRVHDAIRAIHAEHLAESAHDLSDGGLAVTLAESATAEIGAEIALDSDLAPAHLLFHEAPSRILITTPNAARVHEICGANRMDCVTLGVTIGLRIEISNRQQKLVSAASGGLASPGIERFLDRV
jgi:phosphoribosylformylglycinamidine synthase